MKGVQFMEEKNSGGALANKNLDDGVSQRVDAGCAKEPSASARKG